MWRTRTSIWKLSNWRKPNSNSKDEEHLPEQQEMIQEKKELNNIYTLPIKIPSFIPKEPIKKSGETALDDLREDFLYLRAIEREQYRKHYMKI